jgi:hypothetical protein
MTNGRGKWPLNSDLNPLMHASFSNKNNMNERRENEVK